MAWQKLTPEGAAQIAPWTSEDETEVPLFQRVMKITYRFHAMKKRLLITALLLLGLGAGHLLPFKAWLGVVGAATLFLIVFGIECLRSYLRAERIQLEALNEQGFKEVKQEAKQEQQA